MMYLRHTTLRKDGKVHRYWRLVRSVRVGRKARGHVRAQRAVAGKMIRGHYGASRVLGGFYLIAKTVWRGTRTMTRDQFSEQLR